MSLQNPAGGDEDDEDREDKEGEEGDEDEEDAEDKEDKDEEDEEGDEDNEDKEDEEGNEDKEGDEDNDGEGGWGELCFRTWSMTSSLTRTTFTHQKKKKINLLPQNQNRTYISVKMCVLICSQARQVWW